MSSPNHSSSSAIVVELAGFRSGEKSTGTVAGRSLEDAGRSAHASQIHQADMLSMRRHLSYQASVEIDKLDTIRSEYGDAYCAVLGKQIRAILNKEFGRLRVHRYRRLYVIRHRSVEGLISKLLRAQIHSHQIDLPLINKAGEPSGGKAVSLTWGVGRTTTEAEVERLRRRRQKFRR